MHLCRELIITEVDDHVSLRESELLVSLIKACDPRSLDLSCIYGLSTSAFSSLCISALNEMDNLDELYLHLILKEGEHFPGVGDGCAHKLKDLFLEQGTISSSCISNLTSLEYLQLSRTQVSDEAWSDLAALPCRKNLRTSVNMHGMRFLSSMTRLEELDLSNSENIDVDNLIYHMKTLTQLRKLNLSDTGVTDLGLRHLAYLTNLEELCLSLNDNITGAGVKEISHLTGLKSLDLSCTGVGFGDGFGHISRLVQLQELNLSECDDVTDDMMISIAPLSSLKKLDLSDCYLTDTGLQYIASLTQLVDLDLSCTWIGTNGLEPITSLTRLNCLDVSSTSLTDAGLEHIKCLTELRLLVMYNCNVSHTAVKALNETLPNLELICGDV